MSAIGEIAFALVLLLIGLVSVANPSGVRLFGERFGGQSWFSAQTVERSIRVSGVLALLMALAVFALFMYAR